MSLEAFVHNFMRQTSLAYIQQIREDPAKIMGHRAKFLKYCLDEAMPEGDMVYEATFYWKVGGTSIHIYTMSRSEAKKKLLWFKKQKELAEVAAMRSDVLRAASVPVAHMFTTVTVVGMPLLYWALLWEQIKEKEETEKEYERTSWLEEND